MFSSALVFKNLFITTFFLFFSWKVFSQEKEYILGKLVDDSNNKPIVFATIQLKGHSVGVISNSNGSFKIPSYYNDIGSEITISCIGYETLEMNISELKVAEVNVISIKPKVTNLDGVTVSAKKKRKPLSARNIVKRAINAIPKNYDIDRFSLVGYYREYQFEDNEYVNLSEAILEVFDKGFNQIDKLSTRVSIYNREVNNDFKIDTLARLPYDYQTGQKTIEKAFIQDYGGNEFVILRIHDPIRNYKINSFDFINNLRSDFIRNHSFWNLGFTNVDSEPLHIISSRKYLPNYLAEGKLYISKYDFSIHKIEYAVYNRAIDEKKPINNKFKKSKQLMLKTIVEYRKTNNKMYLNYSSFQNYFTVKEPPAFRIEKIVIDPMKKAIEIEFNLEPDNQSALKSSSYSIKHNGNKLKINFIEIQGKSVLLYPEITNNDIIKAANIIRKGDLTSEPIEIEVENNIKSQSGYVLNERLTKVYHQFREFFVQKINERKVAPTMESFMDFEKPIFGAQPISRPNEKLEIWMNTPLKTIKTAK